MDSSTVSALPNIMLVGNESEAMLDLCCSLGNAGVKATFRSFDAFDVRMLRAYCILLIDIDSNQGIEFARQIASSSHIVVATLSDTDRGVDEIMHIIQPMGYIDLQILLIRAGAVAF